MAKKTLQEAVKYLATNTLKIHKETETWNFSLEEIEKRMAITPQNSIDYQMLLILKKNALRTS
ncbi:MAG: hypothetical protein ACR2IM_09065 [Sediminibacterium sp.]